MSYPSDLTDEQWMLLGPVFNARRKRAGGDEAAREAEGRAEETPSWSSSTPIWLVVPRTAASPSTTEAAYGRAKGAKRVVAVDVTGLPVGALVVPASTHENRASELMLEHLGRQGVTGRLELVLVDRG